ncbi:MAG: aminotransferase class I/II-fold pyridoxal phosphate-dependent enzyme [Bacteroidetes bacterium]|nr:aminotransferase class I/II-fold pyridoxal phosphate-dependent enzyme [Bacteroidota bacterium]
MASLLDKAFDVNLFRKNAYKLVDELSNYLEKTITGKSELKVLPFNSPDEMFSFWEKDFDISTESNLNEFYTKIINSSIHLHDPKYIGHQVPPVLPAAALSDFLSSFMNNATGVYEMGSTGIALEKLVIKILAKSIGMNNSADGMLTSGGTMGNLTALLALRQAKSNYNIWKEGTKNKTAILVSEESHYSIDRAVRIMGWGDEGIIKVPINNNFKMDVNNLEDAFRRATKKGIEVIGVVANSCSTSLGLFDSLDEISDSCVKNNLWLHVDGAHGGPASFSEKYKHLVKGIEKADSVIIDFHKLLMHPSLVTAVLFKDGDKSYETFSQKASYLWEAKEEKDWYNLGKRTFECTKNTMSLKVYSIIRTYGIKIFDEIVTLLFDLGKNFAELIKERKNFELAVEPESNIVCFRYVDKTKKDEELNFLNRQIRKTIIEDGKFFIVQTDMKNKTYLRTSLMNPFTSIDDLIDLLNEIESIIKRF